MNNKKFLIIFLLFTKKKLIYFINNILFSNLKFIIFICFVFTFF